MGSVHHWRRNDLGLIGIYVAMCAAFALGGQLLMELHAAGECDTTLDPRHLALSLIVGGIALISGAFLRALWWQSTGPRDLKRLLSLGLRRLPYEGHGPRFVACTGATTFVLGVLAQAGERDASRLHDVLGWLIVAILVALVAAFTTQFIVRRLPDVAAAIAATFVIPQLAPRSAFLSQHEVPIVTQRLRWSAPLFTRPPPLQA